MQSRGCANSIARARRNRKLPATAKSRRRPRPEAFACCSSTMTRRWSNRCAARWSMKATRSPPRMAARRESTRSGPRSPRRMPYDIVITDLAMPDVDGRQVVASLRATVTRHSDRPADRLAASARRSRRASAAGGPAARQAAAHSRTARGARRTHGPSRHRSRSSRSARHQAGTASAITPATMSAAPAMRQGPESSRSRREPNHAPTSVDSSRAGATWLMGAMRMANSTRM